MLFDEKGMDMSRDYVKRSRASSTAPAKNKREPGRLTRAKPRPARAPSKANVQARRIKRRSVKTKRARKFPVRQFLFLVALLILMVMIVLLVRAFSDKMNQSIHPRAPVVEAIPVSLSSQPGQEKAVIQKPTFVFKSQDATGSQKSEYRLQLGTYAQTEALDSFKKELRRLNIPFQSVPIRRAQAQYYRLMVGPFNDEATALKMQFTLRQHRIFAVVLKE